MIMGTLRSRIIREKLEDETARAFFNADMISGFLTRHEFLPEFEQLICRSSLRRRISEFSWRSRSSLHAVATAKVLRQ